MSHISIKLSCDIFKDKKNINIVHSFFFYLLKFLNWIIIKKKKKKKKKKKLAIF